MGMRILLAIVFCASVAGAAVPNILRVQSRSVRVAKTRDYTTIPGKVIVGYERDGRPDWIKPAVETQDVTVVTGVKVNTAMEDALAEAEPDHQLIVKLAKSSKRLDKDISKVIKTLEKGRDKASGDEREAYVTLLEIIDRALQDPGE